MVVTMVVLKTPSIVHGVMHTRTHAQMQPPARQVLVGAAGRWRGLHELRACLGRHLRAAALHLRWPGTNCEHARQSSGLSTVMLRHSGPIFLPVIQPQTCARCRRSCGRGTSDRGSCQRLPVSSRKSRPCTRGEKLRPARPLPSSPPSDIAAIVKLAARVGRSERSGSNLMAMCSVAAFPCAASFTHEEAEADGFRSIDDRLVRRSLQYSSSHHLQLWNSNLRPDQNFKVGFGYC
jgi:hypothetical protein